MATKQHLIKFWKDNFNFKDKELNAFSKINREWFVLDAFQDRAYDDIALPIMRGKTISQPTTVMIMTSALELKEGDKVFEIGTGSGYQSAIIAAIIGPMGKVITTEVIPELVHYARERHKRAGLGNVSVKEEDGSMGMPEEAPFDKIIITAACREFPTPLLKQLKVGGIILAPIGNRQQQMMIKAVKQKFGQLDQQILGPFLFTPLYGKYGFEV